MEKEEKYHSNLQLPEDTKKRVGEEKKEVWGRIETFSSNSSYGKELHTIAVSVRIDFSIVDKSLQDLIMVTIVVQMEG